MGQEEVVLLKLAISPDLGHLRSDIFHSELSTSQLVRLYGRQF